MKWWEKSRGAGEGVEDGMEKTGAGTTRAMPERAQWIAGELSPACVALPAGNVQCNPASG